MKRIIKKYSCLPIEMQKQFNDSVFNGDCKTTTIPYHKTMQRVYIWMVNKEEYLVLMDEVEKKVDFENEELDLGKDDTPNPFKIEA